VEPTPGDGGSLEPFEHIVWRLSDFSYSFPEERREHESQREIITGGKA